MFVVYEMVLFNVVPNPMDDSATNQRFRVYVYRKIPT